MVICLLLIVGVFFFTSQYSSARNQLEKEAENLTTESGEFFRFTLGEHIDSELSLLPVPKSYVKTKGAFEWPQNWQVDTNLTDAAKWVERLLSVDSGQNTRSRKITFIENKSLGSEAYELFIKPSGITVNYAHEAGAYYALVTLHHLQQQFPDRIHALQIMDKPDLAVRGLMYDISRDKVPQMHTLKALVDMLSSLKYNHLELYVEGFSFAYPSFKDLWEGKETPITPAEIRELDAYCKERFIELVPNQNSLGHMNSWLETPRFEHLAECPDGYELMPMRKVKTTLDPSNKESIELVEQMMKDIMPSFSSNKFNANLDEPFELGHCKNAALAEEIGVGQIYLDHVLKVYEIAKANGKEFWMWGDVIAKHPELLNKLPKDITLLEWGYEQEHPFDENTAKMKATGLDFVVCPGTSSWMSLTGRTDNMLGNIENAILSAYKNGAKGMLLTDWGDMGHWQYLPVSYPGYVYAGAISWNSSTSKNLPFEKYLNTHVFEDAKNELAGIVLDMGRSYHFEERHLPNMSHNFMAYQFGISDPVLEQAIFGAIENKIPELVGDSLFAIVEKRFAQRKQFDFLALDQHLQKLETSLNFDINEESLTAKELDKKEIRNELRNGIQMVRLGAEIRYYGQQKEHWSSAERITFLDSMQSRLVNMQEEHRRLWLLRNKSGGLDRSMKAFANLESQINDLLETEKGGSVRKSVHRLKEQVIAGGVNWYVNE